MRSSFNKCSSYFLIFCHLFVFNLSYAIGEQDLIFTKDTERQTQIAVVPIRQINEQYVLDFEDTLRDIETPITFYDEVTREPVAHYLARNHHDSMTYSLSVNRPIILRTLLQGGHTVIDSRSNVRVETLETTQNLQIHADQVEIAQDFRSDQQLKIIANRFTNHQQLFSRQLTIEAREEGHNIDRIFAGESLELSGRWINYRDALLATEGIFQVTGSYFQNEGTYVSGIGSIFNVSYYGGYGSAVVGLWNIIRARTLETAGLVEIGEEFFFQGGTFTVNADTFTTTSNQDDELISEDLLEMQITHSFEVEANNIPESNLLVNQFSNVDDFEWVTQELRYQLNLDLQDPIRKRIQSLRRKLSLPENTLERGVRLKVRNLLKSEMEILLEKGPICFIGEEVILRKPLRHGNEERDVTYVEGVESIYVHTSTLGNIVHLNSPLKRFRVSHEPDGVQRGVLFEGASNEELIYEDSSTPQVFGAGKLVLSGGETYSLQEFSLDDLVFDESGVVFLRKKIKASNQVTGRARRFDVSLRDAFITTDEILLNAKEYMLLNFEENSGVIVKRGRLEVKKDLENIDDDTKNILSLWNTSFENSEDLELRASRIDFHGEQQNGRFLLNADKVYIDRTSEIKNRETHLNVCDSLYSSGKITTDILRAKGRDLFFLGPIEARIQAIIESSESTYIDEIRTDVAQIQTRGTLNFDRLESRIVELRTQGLIMGGFLSAEFAELISQGRQYLEEVNVTQLVHQAKSVSIDSLSAKNAHIQATENVTLGNTQKQKTPVSIKESNSASSSSVNESKESERSVSVKERRAFFEAKTQKKPIPTNSLPSSNKKVTVSNIDIQAPSAHLRGSADVDKASIRAEKFLIDGQEFPRIEKE